MNFEFLNEELCPVCGHNAFEYTEEAIPAGDGGDNQVIPASECVHCGVRSNSLEFQRALNDGLE